MSPPAWPCIGSSAAPPPPPPSGASLAAPFAYDRTLLCLLRLVLRGRDLVKDMHSRFEEFNRANIAEAATKGRPASLVPIFEFTPVEHGSLSYDSQALISAHMWALVGTHGAGLSHQFFMVPGAGRAWEREGGAGVSQPS